MIPILTHFFQVGWFNHQLDSFTFCFFFAFWVFLVLERIFVTITPKRERIDGDRHSQKGGLISFRGHDKHGELRLFFRCFFLYVYTS